MQSFFHPTFDSKILHNNGLPISVVQLEDAWEKNHSGLEEGPAYAYHNSASLLTLSDVTIPNANQISGR